MPATKPDVSIRLTEDARRRLDKAASIMNRSAEDIMRQASDELARQVLLDWATARYREGERTYGELAEETGLSIEEIMMAMGRTGRDEALDEFLSWCRSVAEQHGDPDFLHAAQRAVDEARGR